MLGKWNPIPGHENDKIIIQTRRHIVSSLSIILMLLFMICLPIVLLTFLRINVPTIGSSTLMNFIVIAGSVYYLSVATFVFTAWINYYYDILIVTNNEVIDVDQNGIFDRRVTELSILRVQDVSARVKGFIPTFFNYGDVVAESAGENSQTYVIDCVPNPVFIANKIMELHNEHIHREDRTADMMIGEGEMSGNQAGYKQNQAPTANAPMPQVVQDQDQIAVASLSDMQDPIEKLTRSSSVQVQSPAQPQSQSQDQTQDQSQTEDQDKNVDQTLQTNVSKDDLDKGGEVKF